MPKRGHETVGNVAAKHAKTQDGLRQACAFRPRRITEQGQVGGGGEKGSLEMAAVSSGRIAMESQSDTEDRLKRLYPAVDEEKFPLPRSWSPKEKYNYIGLSQNNLRVHYKGKISQGLLIRYGATSYYASFVTIVAAVL